MTAPERHEQASTVKDIAALLNVHPITVYTKAASGDIPGFKVGRSWRFFESEVIAALNAPADPWQRSSHSRARRRAA